MTDDRPPSERREPVGTPVVRGDPEIAGERAAEAATFDPDDSDDLAAAAEAVREFAAADEDVGSLAMLRGAAACAALVRGTGSYRGAADRAGEGVSVDFLRKWARVHDLPIAVRRAIARGDLAPSAAKHVARVAGDARFLLAWAAIDGDLSAREVRAVASEVTDGAAVEDALRKRGVEPGAVEATLPTDVYRELRRQASLADRSLDDVLAEAVEEWNAERG